MLYKIIPVILITRMAGFLARSRCRCVKSIFIRWFARHFKINMAEAAVHNLADYASFHDFFIRKLQVGARPIDHNPQSFVSPVDGAVSQLGSIASGKLLQAKGMKYTTQALLAMRAADGSARTPSGASATALAGAFKATASAALGSSARPAPSVAASPSAPDTACAPTPRLRATATQGSSP